jgi:hypothetical protein
MKTQAKTRLVRFGDARRLTRAIAEGPFTELNTSRKWHTPPE